MLAWGRLAFLFVFPVGLPGAKGSEEAEGWSEVKSWFPFLHLCILHIEEGGGGGAFNLKIQHTFICTYTHTYRKALLCSTASPLAVLKTHWSPRVQRSTSLFKSLFLSIPRLFLFPTPTEPGLLCGAELLQWSGFKSVLVLSSQRGNACKNSLLGKLTVENSA